MTIRKRALVSGRVQGVFFRDSCRRYAEEQGVAGSARNLSDGRVEVIAEGEPEAVERVIEWCRSGPQWADVDSVDVTDEQSQGLTTFKVN